MKKRLLRYSTLIFALLFAWQYSNAQCTIGTGANTSYGTVFPNCGSYYQTPTNFGPGQFALMPMLIGGSYTVNTCGNGTYQGYDTQITARRTNDNVLGYNDDVSPNSACGTGSPLGQNLSLNSYLDLSGTVNEYVRVGVKRYNCQPNASGSSSIYVRFRQNNNLSWGSTGSSACEGSSVSLNATPAPNATSLGAANRGTYAGTGVSGTTWTAPSVSINSTYNITYTFGACVINRTMTSLAFPNAVASISGDLTPCTGVATTYTAGTSPNASSYEWILPSGWTGSSTTASISVTPNAASGTIQVRGVNSCGNGPWMTLALDPINPVITLTNNSTTICSGDDTAILLSSSESGSTFTWTVSSTGSITGASGVSGFTGTVIAQTLTNTGTTQGSVTYTVHAVASGCNGPTASVTVLVDPSPNGFLSGATTICEGDATDITFNLNVGTGPFDVNVSDGTNTFVYTGISDGHIVSVNPTVTTTYTITSITDANNCNRTSGFGSSVTISVDEAPNGTISAVTPVCDGTATTLTFNFTTGTGPYNISYTDGSSTFTASGISSGATASQTPSGTVTYSFVSIEDVNGCTRNSGFSGDATVSVTPLPVVTATNNLNPICSGDNTSISLNSSEGSSVYTWTTTVSGSITGYSDISGFAGSLISQTLTNSGTTQGSVTYDIYATAALCDGPVTSVTVLVDPLPNGSLSGATTICEGDATDITFNLTVGTGPFTVNYTDGSSTFVETGISNGHTESVNPTVTTTYTITSITDANGCDRTSGFGSNVTITVNEMPDGTMSVVTPVCQGDATTLSFIFTAGTGPYNVSYTDGISTFSETGVSTGSTVSLVPPTSVTYNYTSIEDANGCTRTVGFSGNAQVTVTPPVNVEFTGLASDYCDSEPSVTLTGNQAPGGTFTGSGITDLGNGTATFNPGSAGVGAHYITYTFIDINSCTNSDVQSVNIDEQSIANAGTDGDECDLDFIFNGTASVGNGTWTATGPGTAFYDDVSSATSGVTVDAYGTYIFTWTEVNGVCSSSDQIMVNFYEQPVANAGVDAEECDLDFVFTAVASVGTGTWTQLTGPGTSSFVDGSDANTTVTVSVSGTYTFEWSETEGVCSDADAVSIVFDPSQMASSIIASNTSLCAGESATLTVDGGHLGLDAQWQWYSGSCGGTVVGVGPTIVVDPLTTTDYFVHSIGTCDTTMCVSVEIVVSDPPEAGFSSIENPSDCGMADGSITAIATGGTPPYSFEWSNGSTSASITGLSAGPYIVTITDAAGCTDVSSVSLNDPGASVVFLTSSDPDNTICGGESVTFTATGAFQYEFFVDGLSAGTQNPFTTNTLTNGQIVNVTGTDLNFCSYTTAGIVMNVHDAPVITETIVDPTVCATADGSISLNVTGGNPGYNAVWATGQTTLDITGLLAGPYFVTVTDQNGCSTDGTYALNDPGATTVSLTSSEDPDNEICEGESITFTAAGSMNYEFFVDGQAVSTTNPYSTSTLTNGQSVLVTATDNGNCTSISNIIYPTVNPGSTIGLTSNAINNTICVGQSISFFATGAVMYEFFVDGISQGAASTTSVFVSSTLTTGQVVTVLGSDGNQCEVLSAGITVTVNSAPTVSIVSETQPTACAATDGAATALATGGTPGYTYTWSNGTVGPTVTSLSAGSYFVEVVDNAGCTASTSTSLSDIGSTPVTMTTDLSTDTLCGGATVTFTATNGFASYVFYVNGQPASTQNPYLTDSLSDGDIVAVSATDSMLCSSTSNPFEFTVLPEIQISISSFVNPSVCAATDGSANSLVIGGVPPYTYIWTDGQTTASATGLAAGPYSVTVIDANGCTATAAVSLSDPGGFSVSIAADPSDLAICEGTEVEFTGTGATAYEFFIDGVSVGMTNPYLTSTLLDGQTVTVSGTDINNCTATSPGLTYQVNTVVAATLALQPNETCSDIDTVVLAGGLPLGGEYTVDYFGTPVTGNLLFPNLAGPGTIDVEYTYTTLAGCSSSATDQYTIYETPVANAGNGGNECDFDFMFSAIPTVGTGTWTQTSGPGTSTFIDENDAATTVTVSMVGTYIFQWEEVEGICSDMDTLTVNFYDQPVADAGTGGDECDLDFTFSATPSFGTGTWSQTNGPGTSTFIDANDALTDVTVSAYGTYTFQWEEIEGTCLDAATVMVNFYEQPVANAGSGGDECDLDFLLNATSSVGNGTWSQVSGPGTSIFFDANNFTTTVTADTYGTYEYQWLEVNGTCSDSATITVNYYLQPVADAGLGSEECDLDFTFSATMSTAGTGVWTYTGPGIATFSDDTDSISDVTVDSVGTYIFTWTETNVVCVDSDTVAVTFYDQPVAVAGIGGNECDLDFIFSADPSYGIGTWSQTSGPGFSNYSDENDPTGTVTVSEYGTYIFLWSELNGVCADNGSVTVNFYEQPVADAGNGGDECDLDFILGASPSVGTGTWTQLSGPGTSTFIDENDAATTVTVTAPGTYDFQWEEVEGSCSDAATITVNFYEQPVANAGTGGDECDLGFTFSAIPSFGTGTWSQTNGPGSSTFIDENDALTDVTVSAYGTYTFQWEEINGTCDDAATVMVNFYEQPVANAGTGGDECDLNFLLNAISSVGNGTWTQTSGPGTSTFVNANSANTTVTVDTYGTYEYQWEEVNGTCSDIASITVNYYLQPVANAGAGGDECDLDFTLSATLSTGGSGLWTSSGPGNAVFINNTDPLSDVTVDAVGSYTFTWTETNGVCIDSDEVTVNFYDQPVADAGAGGDECDLNFIFSANPSFGTGTWSQTSGPGFSNYSDENDAAATVTVSLYGTYEFTWTEVNGVCTDDASITVNFYEQPIANAGNGGDECDLDFIFSAIPSVGSGTWTQVSGPGTSTFVDPNDAATTVSVSMLGTYVYQWEEVEGTCSDAASITVNYYEQPVANAGFGGSECDLDFVLGATTSVGIGTWTFTGPGVTTFAPNENDPTATATVDTYGTYIFTWTEDNNGCTDNSSISVDFHLQTVADAGNGGDECDLNFVFNATPSIGTGVWTASGPGNAFFSNANDPAATVTVDAYGAYLFTWTETNGTCVATDQVAVNFYEQPVANAGNGGDECDLNFSFSAVPSVGNGQWLQTSGPGTSTYILDSDPSTIVTVTQYGTYEFTWAEVNGTCADSDVISVNFYEQPVANAGLGGDECDLDFNMNGALSSGSGIWSYSGPGTATFIDGTDPATTVTVSDYGTYNFTFTEINGTCEDDATISVNFYEQPVANAGNGGQVCNLNFLLSATPSVGNGMWTMTSGPGNATFGTPAVQTSTVDVDAYGTYEFTWTETNGTCVDFATVSVDFFLMPTANAGVGGQECDLDFILNATASVGTGEWTMASGPGTAAFASPTSASTTVTVTQSGTYSFTWTETNGVCVDDASVNVDFFDQPVANAGQGGDECDLDFTFNAVSSFGTGTWTATGPGNAAYSNANSPISNVTVDTYGTYTFTWSEVNGICTDDESITVNFYEQPVADAGTGNSQCDLDFTFNGTASVGIGTWTYSGPGTATFTPNASDVNATVTVDATGTYTFTWTEDNNGCTDSEDLPITFNALPVVSFTGLMAPYCVDQIAPVNLTGIPSGGTFSGTGISGNSFVPAVAGVGTFDITYTYTDGNGCTDSETQTIEVHDLPVVSFTALDASYCESDAMPHTLIGTPAGGTFSGPGISGNDFTASVALAGTHTITYTFSDGFGCENSETQTVIVNQLPVVSFTGLDLGYCADAFSVSLNGTPAGGTFSGPGMIGSDFNPATAGVGIHDITYSYTDGNGCENTETQTVEVFELPQPVVSPAGNVELCMGSTLTLDAGAGYASYDWDGLGNDQTLDVTTAGLYTVTVTTADGCVATSSATIVSINPLPVVDLGADTTICTGGNVTLDAGNAGSTFLWSTMENSQTITVNATNNYSVTVTDANGCSSTDEIVVQIQGDIEPIIVALGPSEFCAGGSVTLDAGAQYTNFLWGNNETTQTITVTQEGIYEVVVQDEFGCSGTSQPFIVSVFQLPNAVIVPDGPTNICAGDTVTLTASNAFVDYLWSPNNEITQSIEVTQSGSFTVLVTDPINGCQNESAAMVVQVNTPQSPEISWNGNLEFCIGSSVVLDAGTGFNSYLWSSGSTTQSITVTESGDYAVTVLNPNNCIDSTLLADPVHVEVWDPQPIAQHQGDSIVVNGGPFAFYQWYLNGELIPGATGATLNPAQSGNYTVMVTDENGCEATSNNVEFTFIGVEEVSDVRGLNIYPNPNKGESVIEATFAHRTDVDIVILDVSGKVVQTYDLLGKKELHQVIDIDHLPNGVYQLRLKTDESTTAIRVVKL